MGRRVGGVGLWGQGHGLGEGPAQQSFKEGMLDNPFV